MKKLIVQAAETKVKSSWKQAFSAAFPLTLPVLTGFSFLGIAYGILMESKGYGPFWSFLMSAVAFCGSMQYVAVTLLTAVFHPLEAFALSLMVNARHLFYGLSMLSTYRGVGKVKAFLIYTMCDETFSITYSAKVPEGMTPGRFYFAISFLDYRYWVLASLFGGVLGRILGSMGSLNTTGLDFVLTALFVVIFLEQLKNPDNRRSAWIGVACSAACLAVLGESNFLIAAMLCMLVVLSLLRKSSDGGESL
ncbi:MAG: AzlC family ABC transporter permease [Pygmaiobacter sp.]